MNDLVSTHANPGHGSGLEEENILNPLNILFGYRPRQYCLRPPSHNPTIAAVGAFQFCRPNEAWDVTGGLEAQHGLLKSSRLARDGILLN